MRKKLRKFFVLDEVGKLSLMKFFLNLFFLSPVAVFFYQSKGLNYFQILSLESVFVLFMFLFEVPTGVFADKFGRKKSVILGTLLLSTEPFIYLFAKSYFVFAVSFAISAIGFTFLSGTIEALIYDRLKSKGEESLMKKSMGRYESAGLLAMVIAPIIGSWIAKDLSSNQFTILILMTAVTMFIGFAISFFIEDTKKKRVEEDNPLQVLKEGIKVVKGNKSLIHIVILSMFTSPFTTILIYLFQPYLKEAGVNIALFGTIMALALLSAAIFQRYSYKVEELFGVKRGVFLTTLLPGILYLFMAYVFSPILSVILFITLKAIADVRKPLFSDYKNLHIPSRVRATSLSLITMFTSIYQVVMRLVLGKLADISLSYTFLFMGAVIIVASIFLRIDERHVDKQLA